VVLHRFNLQASTQKIFVASSVLRFSRSDGKGGIWQSTQNENIFSQLQKHRANQNFGFLLKMITSFRFELAKQILTVFNSAPVAKLNFGFFQPLKMKDTICSRNQEYRFGKSVVAKFLKSISTNLNLKLVGRQDLNLRPSGPNRL